MTVAALAATALLAWSVIIAFHSVALVFAHQNIVPFWDQWYEVSPSQQLHHLFQRNAEHVAAVPRLIYILDYVLTGGRNTLNIAVIFGIQVLQCALLIRLYVLSKDLPHGSLATWAATGLVIASLFNLVQWENFAWGFQVQFVLVYLFGTLAFTTAALELRSWRNQVCVILLGVAATLTMANGAAVPVIAVGLALMLGAERKTLLRLCWAIPLAWGILGAAQLFPSTSGNFRAPWALNQLWPLLRFLFATLGSPFVGSDQWPTAVTVGAVGTGLFASLTCFIVGDRVSRHEWRRAATSRERAQLALLAVAGFSFASSSMIAVGRTMQGLGQAFASRYSTPAILFWLSMLLILLGAIPRGLRLPLALLSALGACMLAGGWLDRARGILQNREASLRETETAMLAGVPDWIAYSAAGPKSWTSIPQTPEMRRLGLSVFSEPWANWLGKPAADYVPFRNREVGCKGALESAEEIAPGAWRLTGWSTLGPKLLMVDGSGIVVGYGMTGVSRPDIAAANGDLGWIGHARMPAGAFLSVLALRADGRGACQITEPRQVFELPTTTTLESSDFGPVRVSLQGGWVKGHGSMNGQSFPFKGNFFESYNGSYAKVGRLRMSFHISPHDVQLYLPYMTGPTSRDIGISLRLAGSGAPINEWILPAQASWSSYILRIPDVYLLAAEGQDVVLDVLDYGSGWGQWLAVGLPQAQPTAMGGV